MLPGPDTAEERATERARAAAESASGGARGRGGRERVSQSGCGGCAPREVSGGSGSALHGGCCGLPGGAVGGSGLHRGAAGGWHGGAGGGGGGSVRPAPILGTAEGSAKVEHRDVEQRHEALHCAHRAGPGGGRGSRGVLRLAAAGGRGGAVRGLFCPASGWGEGKGPGTPARHRTRPSIDYGCRCHMACTSAGRAEEHGRACGHCLRDCRSSWCRMDQERHTMHRTTSMASVYACGGGDGRSCQNGRLETQFVGTGGAAPGRARCAPRRRRRLVHFRRSPAMQPGNGFQSPLLPNSSPVREQSSESPSDSTPRSDTTIVAVPIRLR